MKKSEMLEKIKQRIYNIQGGDETGVLWPSEDYIAYAILDEVEQAGMSPPFHPEAYYKTWRDGGHGREWEKE